MTRPLTQLVLTLALLAVSACQRPDVGARCTMQWGSGSDAPPSPGTVSADFLETGNSFCDDQICIVSPAPTSSRYGACSGTACGYCSKPCVSNADCYKSETGLVCRQMVLDPAFVATLDEETKQKYLADIRFSSYCAVPR
jgi:hypothetical protein